jgi:hypothetical protein
MGTAQKVSMMKPIVTARLDVTNGWRQSRRLVFGFRTTDHVIFDDLVCMMPIAVRGEMRDNALYLPLLPRGCIPPRSDNCKFIYDLIHER